LTRCLRQSVYISIDLSTVRGQTSSTGRLTNTSEQCARHADDAYDTGRCDDVEADVKLDKYFTVVELCLGVVA